MTNADEDTADFELELDFARAFFAPEQPRFDVHYGGVSHVGSVRSSNEDHYAIIRRTRGQEMMQTNLPSCLALPEEEAYALVVADGMGGQAFGEFASRVTLQMIFELAGRASSWLMRLTDPDMQQVRQRVDAYVQQTQETLQHYARLDPQLRGMGTTCTLAYLMPPHAIVAHIGDSRAYHLHGGSFEQITHDHTLAQKMIDAGIAPEKVRRFRSLLTNALGGEHPDAHAEVNHVELAAGDQLLLCTDGLTNMVDDETIAEQLHSHDDPQAACDRLLELALEAGGEDNITVVVARITPPAASA
ncbi:MAG: protein phosphatase 2C domain-containing protein [Pirellulaceae bacterium]